MLPTGDEEWEVGLCESIADSWMTRRPDVGQQAPDNTPPLRPISSRIGSQSTHTWNIVEPTVFMKIMGYGAYGLRDAVLQVLASRL